MKQWLKDAVFYEIYPQSFYDTNGDGIGDLQGIIAKLNYIKDLGCNALWINPCFDSPFKDAGYDVRDYKKIAPRYGTNQDAADLFRAAHEKGIHVLLDLVPGHTSEEHPWFQASRSDPDGGGCPKLTLQFPFAPLLGGGDSGRACNFLFGGRNAKRPVQAEAGDNRFFAPHIIPPEK